MGYPLPQSVVRQSKLANSVRPNPGTGATAPPVYRPEPPKILRLQVFAAPLQPSRVTQRARPLWPTAKQTVPALLNSSTAVRWQKLDSALAHPVANGRAAPPVYRPQISRPQPPGVLPQQQRALSPITSHALFTKAPSRSQMPGPASTSRREVLSPQMNAPRNRVAADARPQGITPTSAARVMQRAVIALPVPTGNLDEWENQKKEIDELVKNILKRPDAGTKDPASLAGIPDEESIYFVGHASPGGFADFGAARLFEGLKATNLSKTYRGKIILVGCETGVRQHLGFGASLAGQLAGLLSTAGYECRVVGMTGRTFVLQTGEIRVHNDPARYQRAVSDWRERARSFSERELAFRKSGTSSGHTAESFAKERRDLLDELDELKRQHSTTFERGSVVRSGSDSRYSSGLWLAGAVAIGTVAWIYRQQLASGLSGWFG
jgi:hypothetical protein